MKLRKSVLLVFRAVRLGLIMLSFLVFVMTVVVWTRSYDWCDQLISQTVDSARTFQTMHLVNSGKGVVIYYGHVTELDPRIKNMRMFDPAENDGQWRYHNARGEWFFPTDRLFSENLGIKYALNRRRPGSRSRAVWGVSVQIPYWVP